MTSEFKSPVFIKDDTIAFSRLLLGFGDIAIEWPHDASYTPYGFLVPTNNGSANILDYLQFGPDFDDEMVFAKMYDPTITYHAMLIDYLGRVFVLRLEYNEEAKKLVLIRQRVLTGEGAIFAYADSVSEHEKAMMAMRLHPDLEGALRVFLDNTPLFQHQYSVYDIPAIVEELRSYGYMLPLP